MRVAIGFDHAGVSLRDTVLACLEDVGAEVLDFGVDSAERVDYTDHAFGVAEAVSEGRADRGVLCCGTGIGMSLAANRVRGVRAAVVSDVYSARMSREHNDANVLCLGGRVVGPGLAEEILALWLRTEFSLGESHVRRLGAIAAKER